MSQNNTRLNEKLKQHISRVYTERYSTSRKIFYCQFHLLLACQYRCNHCYLNDLGGWNTPQPTLNEVKSILDKIKKAATSLNLDAWVDFTGGDPLLRKDFKEIALYANQLGISFGIKANPDLVTYTLIEELQQLGLGYFQLSLDGLEGTHDTIRRTQGAFSNTLKAIQKLKNMNCVVYVQSTLSQRNHSEFVPLINFLVDQQFVIDGFSWSRYWTDSPSGIEQDMLSKKDVQSLFDTLIVFYEHLFERQDFFITNKDGVEVPRLYIGFKEHLWYPFLLAHKYIDQKIHAHYSSSPNALNCTATKHVYIIDPDGSVYRCRKLRSSYIGNIAETDEFINLAYGTKSTRFLHTLKTSECGHCNFFNVCAGCAAIQDAKYRTINQHDPDCFIHTK